MGAAQSDNSVLFNLKSLLSDESARVEARARAEREAAEAREARVRAQREAAEREAAEREASARAKETAEREAAVARETAKVREAELDALKVQLDALAREREAAAQRAAEHARALGELQGKREAQRRGSLLWAAAFAGAAVLGAVGLGVSYQQAAARTAAAQQGLHAGGVSDEELASLRARNQRALDAIASANRPAAPAPVPAAVAPTPVAPRVVNGRPGPRTPTVVTTQRQPQPNHDELNIDLGGDELPSVGLEGASRQRRTRGAH